MVLAGKAVLADQVLVDALGRETGLELVDDDFSPRLTQARLLARCWLRRADGRLAYFGLVGAPLLAGLFCVMSAPLRSGLFYSQQNPLGADGRPGLF
jgi:hypothetical protein